MAMPKTEHSSLRRYEIASEAREVYKKRRKRTSKEHLTNIENGLLYVLSVRFV